MVGIEPDAGVDELEAAVVHDLLRNRKVPSRFPRD